MIKSHIIKIFPRLGATVLTLSIVIALGISFAACSSDDDAASITVNSASGSGVVLSGAWSRCFFEGPNDSRKSLHFPG